MPAGDALIRSPELTVTFLGSGTSTGVPMIGCPCAVCRSSNPRDKRMRPSILVTVHADGGGRSNILVDATPEMRIQTLRAGVTDIDAVLVTHNHADHIFGMDDVRQFNFRKGGPIPVFADDYTIGHIRTVFEYAFRTTPTAGGKPQMDLTEVKAGVRFEVCGVTITPFTVYHGTHPIIAYKFGTKIAYVTDVSRVPDESLTHLRGLDTLILGAVRHESHPTHFSIPQAVAHIEALAPRQAFLTHLSHHVGHDRDNRLLPENVRLGYDGLEFIVPRG